MRGRWIVCPCGNKLGEVIAGSPGALENQRHKGRNQLCLSLTQCERCGHWSAPDETLRLFRLLGFDVDVDALNGALAAAA